MSSYPDKALYTALAHGDQAEAEAREQHLRAEYADNPGTVQRIIDDTYATWNNHRKIATARRQLIDALGAISYHAGVAEDWLRDLDDQYDPEIIPSHRPTKRLIGQAIDHARLMSAAALQHVPDPNVAPAIEWPEDEDG